MIIKGNRHGNGSKLAAYLLDGGKHGERVFAPELHGFGLHPDDLSKSLSALDAIASSKGIQNPLFHVQIRLPQQDHMTREQWDATRTRVLKTLGLEGQPHAFVFHADELTGELHGHLAVSLINEQTHQVKAVPFYKFRLRALARKLENEFDLTRVSSQREGPIKYAATKNEEQQAQRLGVDKDAIRNTIRDCHDRTGCGRDFENELAHEGLILALGNRRDYVVIDHAGGMHALGKRLLDISAGQLREKLADLDRDNIPTIEQAREFLLNLPRDQMDKLTRELAQVQEQLKAERDYANRDPVREEADWLDRLGKAAIEKEKIERQFVEPKQREKEARAAREQVKTGGRKENHWPINPPQPERKAPELFGKAATEAGRDDRMENLTGPASKVWQAWQHSDSAKAYTAALDDKGITFAKATHDEAYRSNREADFAREVGNRGQRLKEGEIVIVTEARPEYRRDGEVAGRSRVYKLDQSLAYKFVKGLDGLDKLQGIDATIKSSDQRAQQRAADWEAIRLERATNTKGRARPLPARAIATAIAKGPLTVAAKAPAVLKPVSMGLNLVGKALEILGGVFEPPVLTPEQKRAGAIAARERQADVREQLEHSNAISESAQERQREEQEEAARQRQREKERER